MKKALLALLTYLSLLPSLCAMTHSEDADSLVNAAHHYYSEYRYMDALDALAKAVERADATSNEIAMEKALLSIGNIHSMFNDYEQALHYYTQCYNKAQNAGNELMRSRAGANMLMCYCMMGDADEAQKCYDKLGPLDMEDPNLTRFYNYLNQGLLARVRKDLHAAIFMHAQALDYARNHEMDGHFAVSQMGQLGTLEEELGNEKQAIDWYLQCEKLLKEGGYISPLVTAYEKLSNLYRKQHNDSASMRYQRLFVSLSDSLFNEREFNSKRGRIVDYETQHNILEISSLNSRNRTLLAVIILFALMLVALIVLISYIFRQNRELVSTQRLLIEKHNELNKQLEMQNRLSDEYFKAPAPSDSQANPLAEIANDRDKNEVSDNAMDEESYESAAPLLSKQQSDILLIAIAKVMEDSHTISDPDFGLQTLANLVGSNTKYVSWAINATYGKNFKTYLNEYRIREASRRLADTEKYGNPTMAVLAEQLGYKSPTSFNQAFKRILGMTPAAYQKLIRQQ